MSGAEVIGAQFMKAVRRAEDDPAGPRGASLLCTVCTELLPVDRAAIIVCAADQNWEMLGASDAIATGFAQAQLAAGEGPGLHAYQSDAPALISDFGAALAGGRWPLLAASGGGARDGGVFSFPLHRGAIRVGSLDLYTDVPTMLDVPGFAAAVRIADLVTVVLLAAVRASAPGWLGTNGSPYGRDRLGPWWEVSASTREIHQATGMIAAQLGVDIATAYARLVATALTTDRPIARFAADIVARRIRFDPDDPGEPGRPRP
ncbi:ANTAR domain-containing protein [Nocardia sp. NPDC056100]|uniref:ANTAR domain-containing protein n=1 Tax=Nocardia sp. NPDC056100 TaxID=3345712 RepID=UPI0035D55E10